MGFRFPMGKGSRIMICCVESGATEFLPDRKLIFHNRSNRDRPHLSVGRICQEYRKPAK
jgi:hypothetical protein